jgi:hypothetical protein
VRPPGQTKAEARELVDRKGQSAMLSKLKEIFSRLSGEGSGAPEAAAATAEVEYKGYMIRPTPYKNNGQYQTSGTIRKDTPEGAKEHKFIRADTYASLDDANAFAIMKAKQLIDQQGDRMFT